MILAFLVTTNAENWIVLIFASFFLIFNRWIAYICIEWEYIIAKRRSNMIAMRIVAGLVSLVLFAISASKIWFPV